VKGEIVVLGSTPSREGLGGVAARETTCRYSSSNFLRIGSKRATRFVHSVASEARISVANRGKEALQASLRTSSTPSSGARGGLVAIQVPQRQALLRLKVVDSTADSAPPYRYCSV
jgi:hypothetical protein